ncbi:MAG: hypothetical protein F6J93_11215 [Oscillatoria sp. SIO1A7]|nr:hypothetical protein [Oscillatoria sp. SIO1A7]
MRSPLFFAGDLFWIRGDRSLPRNRRLFYFWIRSDRIATEQPTAILFSDIRRSPFFLPRHLGYRHFLTRKSVIRKSIERILVN